MPTYTKHVKYVVRPVIDMSDIRFDGLTGDEEDYGFVKVVKITTHERRASGDVGRLLSSHDSEEVVIERLSGDDAYGLIASLSRGIINSHRVRPPR